VLTATNASANSCNASATVTTSSANNYVFHWSNGTFGTTVSNLCPGIVSVMVKDTVTKCTGTFSIPIHGDPSIQIPLKAYLNLKDATDTTNCDGSAKAIGFGGKPGYNYMYSSQNGTIITYDSVATNLCPGLYTLRVMDAAADTFFMDFLIAGPQNIIQNNNPTYIDSTIIDTLIAQVKQNCIIDFATIDSVWVNSKTYINSDSLMVSWSVRDTFGIHIVEVTYVITNAAGVFSLELSVFCPTKSTTSYFKATDQVYINYTEALSGLTEEQSIPINIYPNPSSGKVTIQALKTIDSGKIEILTMDGQVFTSQDFNQLESMNIELPIPQGLYFIRLITEQGTSTYRVIKQ
jgi:Secretion system C-terminal sorting domain